MKKIRYFPIIGLEIHCELKTRTKMFCACLNNPDETRPNKNICPVCSGQPGSLPVPNKKALDFVIKAGLALNCKIAKESKFDRKNYYYPDLPKGYQISQYDMPLAYKGKLKFTVADFSLNQNNQNAHQKSKSLADKTKFKIIRIRRIHIEEDTGKLLHDEKENVSLVDLNRSGVPLMELVTEPDITSGEEAFKFAKILQILFKKYLQISDADMEKGQLRIEANVSLSPDVKKLPNYKVEIKNLNSFKAVKDAINYEIQRQTKLLERGKTIAQETRGWDEKKGKTVPQRFKEQAKDYRYFPEPDIPKLKFVKSYIDEIKKNLPELPWQRKERFIKEYNLSEKDADFFVFEKELGDYFEDVVSELKTLNKNKECIKLAANYIISRLQKLILDSNISVQNLKISAENFAELIHIIAQEKISSSVAQVVLEEMFNTGKDPDHIINERGLTQISDVATLKLIIQQVIQENPKAIEDFKKGKQEILMFLIGQVMKKTKGAANPQLAKDLLLKLLK